MMFYVKFKTKQRLVLLALLLNTSMLFAQVFLTADGQTDTYTLINSTLGGTAVETPDCSHSGFGPHITQAFDDDLSEYSFVFHIHVTPDNDRCVAFDRQRNEIKTYGPSPAYLKGFYGDTVTFRWKFKLDAGFQPSRNFTHIHQIKAADGDAGAPIITLTPRAGTPDILQIIHVDSRGTSRIVARADLSLFRGAWVDAYEQITYGSNGTYSITLTSVSDGSVLLSYSNDNIDLWRSGTTFVRPKWGIYRSLNSRASLRNEQVRFADFCLAKGSDDCPQTSGCVVASAGGPWRDTAFAAQTGTFTAEFDATPSDSPINSVVGLSHGQQSAYTGFAALARFNPAGNIDARNGGSYNAVSTIPYSAGVTYHFRMVVNVPARTYSIFVTPAGGTEQTVGANFAFRTEQSRVTSLEWWGAFAGAGSDTVCNFVSQ